ncbi:unnamed protein product [Ectocarpus fasciculatus]
MSSRLGNAELAFILVCGAGLSTCIGAAAVYHPSYVKLANRNTLAAGLGISAGVMLYVSFIEIFNKSRSAFEDNGHSERDAYSYATLCFFGGFLLMNIMHKIVHLLDPDDIGHDVDFDIYEKVAEGSELAVNSEERVVEQAGLMPHSLTGSMKDADVGVTMADLEMVDSCAPASLSEGQDDASREAEKKKIIDEKLHRMGLVTALAIGIHNFPEGLATFVATLADPTVGIALAVAIAIHNIPEGLCVAIPIYYASADKHKAFMWAMVSGLSEIIAAGLGWIVLSHVVGDLVYAVLFGAVSGMMVNICVYQLLPTAHKYDPTDQVTSNFCLIGMLVMAISLIAFLY